MINKMLPKGFKFESYETIKRQIEQARQAAKQPPGRRRKTEENAKKDEKIPEKPGRKPGASSAPVNLDASGMPIKRSCGRPRKVV